MTKQEEQALRLLGEADGAPEEWSAPRWSIGQAAQRTGVSADTLRYYEREGIMSPAGRTSGGLRRYSELDLEKIACAHWLREAGVPLSTIRQFDTLRDQGRQTLRGRRALLLDHLEELERRRQDIDASIASIQEKIAKYDRLMEARG
ncbi:MerR family DNA-binding transcriptional regulator [Bifidobacterium psychraerophilum]|jgi:DNA-binding transcriptional MerR regulator|uniref:MerR family DNA-binding transcriptional regulator n=1 Tax=Bifidobacterium psychraerophilum TaxID=218140 RepID=UPI0023F2FE1A|nr:MerR family DNA-binding transcriptional regulator [Bifidobacterium psychraerophilum]MCI1660989.1 MerR family DNA-binding transcriptional regulator [Bifidobacterium psychraerophilum]MCI1803728.1 MerR family DNA-binding transcriptional regulator [Bifidobacterium psychraerophilum]MCI2176264.1 MerR family DNA-binding transcriptional regulator [Bifidobacterium psychraerophilum]MCI2181262.1 MerR family DNA-binding transcriptional regulator [Bifidobacterium psychraerophilum]